MKKAINIHSLDMRSKGEGLKNLMKISEIWKDWQRMAQRENIRYSDWHAGKSENHLPVFKKGVKIMF